MIDQPEGNDADALAARLGLVPLPAEGGRFRQTWAGPEDESGRPAGSAILMLLTADPDDFSALHRLPIDEVWHFYRGDALELLLLHPDGSSELRALGPRGEELMQTVVPAGTWMAARVAAGGRWSLFGTTMAPGFVEADYEGGDAGDLARRYPDREDLISALTRADAPTRMPVGGQHGSGTAAASAATGSATGPVPGSASASSTPTPTPGPGPAPGTAASPPATAIPEVPAS